MPVVTPIASAPLLRAIAISSAGSSPMTAISVGSSPISLADISMPRVAGLPKTKGICPVVWAIIAETAPETPSIFPFEDAKKGAFDAVNGTAPAQTASQSASRFFTPKSRTQPVKTASTGSWPLIGSTTSNPASRIGTLLPSPPKTITRLCPNWARC